MNLKQKIHDIVGAPYRDALFYAFPGGLRFELSEGCSPLDMALTALRKATVICDDVFGKEESILVHLVAFVPASPFGLRNNLRELKTAGILIPKVRDFWLEEEVPTEEDDDTVYWVNCAFEVPAVKVQNLLWCAFTTDFGSSLGPNPHCRVYLLNPKKGVVVHPYDDRGMDVISLQSSALAGLYERHYDLLLNYDMGAMRNTFSGSSI
jgi:hypothetical protein